MEIFQALLATNIAVLRRLNAPFVGNEESQILEALRIARRISILEAIAKEAGDEPTYEDPIVEIDKITATTDYATVVSKTITVGKTGIISKMEMACRQDSDYDIVLWRLTVNSKVIFQDSCFQAV